MEAIATVVPEAMMVMAPAVSVTPTVSEANGYMSTGTVMIKMMPVIVATVRCALAMIPALPHRSADDRTCGGADQGAAACTMAEFAGIVADHCAGGTTDNGAFHRLWTEQLRLGGNAKQAGEKECKCGFHGMLKMLRHDA